MFIKIIAGTFSGYYWTSNFLFLHFLFITHSRISIMMYCYVRSISMVRSIPHIPSFPVSHLKRLTSERYVRTAVLQSRDKGYVCWKFIRKPVVVTYLRFVHFVSRTKICLKILRVTVFIISTSECRIAGNRGSASFV